MGRTATAALAGLLVTLGSAAGPTPVWRPCAHVSVPELRESSGIVASRQFADVLWVHNDSGDTARLFAIDHGGRLLREVHLRGARNIDWEDLTTDDAGNLYVGDFGNNKNERRDLVVYVLREPDPRAPGDAIVEVPVQQRLPFFFPDQRAYPDPDQLNFDCESMYWDAGRLYVLTKHRSDSRTALYRLPAPGDSVAVRLGDADIGSQVTAAALSPDRSHLVVLSYQYLHVFTRPPGSENFLSGAAHRILIEGRQCEGVCFTSPSEILFTNEQREIYCLHFSDLLASTSFLPTPPEVHVAHASPAKSQGWKPQTRLALRAEPPELESRGRAPEVRLGWCDAGLVLQAKWPLATDVAPAGETLLYVMCGPVAADEPRLQPGQQVWEARWMPAGVELRPLLPVPGPALGDCAARRTKRHLVVDALVPGALRPGATLALNVIARAPGDSTEREWVWAGGSSTQPLENPLLWGRAELVR